MNAYYVQIAEKIFPIYGVSSMQEAQNFASNPEHVVETSDSVYMNLPTGSVDFASNWMTELGATEESELSDDHGLVEVKFDAESESWVEA